MMVEVSGGVVGSFSVAILGGEDSIVLITGIRQANVSAITTVFHATVVAHMVGITVEPTSAGFSHRLWFRTSLVNLISNKKKML